MGARQLHFALTISLLAALLMGVGSVGASLASPTAEPGPLPEGRKDHAMIAVQGRLYVIGGMNALGTIVRTIYRQETGGWSVDDLPEPLYQAAAVGYDNSFYVLGGYNGANTLRAVRRASLGPDGEIVSWADQPQLPGKLSTPGIALSSYGDIFVSGGWTGNAASRAVYSARIQPDGSLGPWGERTPLPSPLFRHAMATRGGFLYVVGGRDDQLRAREDLYVAQIGSDGSLSGWRGPFKLARPSYSHQAIVLGARLYVLGGYDGQQASAAVDVYQLDDLGNAVYIGQADPPLRTALYSFGAAAIGDTILVSGGSNAPDSDPLRDVYVAAALPTPTPPPTATPPPAPTATLIPTPTSSPEIGIRLDAFPRSPIGGAQEITYTASLSHERAGELPDVLVRGWVPVATSLMTNSLTVVGATATLSGTLPDASLFWWLPTLPGGGTPVTVSYRVHIPAGSLIYNQGVVAFCIGAIPCSPARSNPLISSPEAPLFLPLQHR